MKNKEIEKRLKDSLDYEFDLSFNERKELLSYIEQLEKDNYDLDKENQILFESNLKLKNNRDKAIELLNELTNLYDDNYTVSDKAKDIKYILKGDSDE